MSAPPAAASPLARAWPWLQKLLLGGFFALVLWLLIEHARAIDWAQVWVSMRKFDALTLALMALFTALSYGVYACTDLFARVYLKLPVPPRLAMSIAFVCYAFNLNLGSWVGSIGFRYRLYTRFGLDAATIARIVGLSLVTNWSGYLLIAGIAFVSRVVKLPAGWDLGTLGLQLCGGGLLVAWAGYLAACGFSKRREFSIRDMELSVPNLQMALTQVAVSSMNWLAIGAVLWVPLREHADYPVVLATLFLAAIAGAVTHIPAGLGVTEAVFFGVLGGHVAHPELLAALLVYRGIYYLAPLAIAAVLYAGLEASARRLPQPQNTG